MTETNSAAQLLDTLASISDLLLFDREVMDSMKTGELIVALEEQFGVQISPAELDREMWATPRKIIADIQRRLEK